MSGLPAPAGDNYFMALIRSSSLRIGSAPLARDVRRGSQDDLVEIVEQADALAPAQPPSAPPERRSGVEAVDRRSTEHVDVAEAAPRRVEADSKQQPSRTSNSVAPMLPSAAANTQQVTESQVEAFTDGPVRPPAFDPVRIAMQWVAADPQARAALRPPSRPAAAEAQAPAAASQPASRRDEPIVVEELEVQTPAVMTDAIRRRPMSGQPASRAIAAPARTSSADFEPAAVDGRTQRSAAAVEEVFEISIGAINLHVEGPRQTVVQPPPVRPPTTAAPRRERSGLARRYLRSF